MTKITSPRKEICRENIGATRRINANTGEKEASRNAPKEGIPACFSQHDLSASEQVILVSAFRYFTAVAEPSVEIE